MALTIAGSDSGGGAGIQADLKTFEAFGVFGTSALTCITAQNPDAVTAVAALDPDMVRAQIEAVCDGFPVAAAKTGMLYSTEIIRAVADCVEARKLRMLVVDPVMVATSGARLLREDAVKTLCEALIPRAYVVTPNLPEAEILIGKPIRDLDAAVKAAGEIGRRFGTACVVKGGHLEGERVTEVLYAGGRVETFDAARVHGVETHGTGCTFSAALCAGLAKGETLSEAVRAAQAFVGRALAHSVRCGRHGPMGWGRACGRDGVRDGAPRPRDGQGRTWTDW